MLESEMILKVLNNSKKPLMSKDIVKHVYHMFDGFKIEKKIINDILWNELKDEVYYNRENYTYWLKHQNQVIIEVDKDPSESKILNDIFEILFHIQNLNDVTVQNIHKLLNEFSKKNYSLQDIRRVYHKNDVEIFKKFHLTKEKPKYNAEENHFELNNGISQKEILLKNNTSTKNYNQNWISEGLKQMKIKNIPAFQKIIECFISIHNSDFQILETQNEKLNELIKLVAIDNRITNVEKMFLIEKTKELELSIEIVDLAKNYLGSNNPILDKIFVMILQDGKIDKIEIDFIREKSTELGLNQEMVNERFWAFAIHFHLNDLIKLECFRDWIVHWYLQVYSNTRNLNNIKQAHKFLDIFSDKSFNEMIEISSLKLKQENQDIDNVNKSNHINLTELTSHDLQLTNLSKLHLDALCWFSVNKNKSFEYKELCGEKLLTNGQIYLFNTAKGIHKPKTEKYALSIKVLKDNFYNDIITENSEGSWLLNYHKEDGSEWTNDGLIKCMEDNVPIGLFYQTKSPPNPIYKVYGLGLIHKYDGIFFQVREIDKLKYENFNWNPERNKSEENKSLTNQELEILELYDSEPFIAMQRFKEYYKVKNDKRISNLEITEAFNLFIETNK
jgi:hypothetical protein